MSQQIINPSSSQSTPITAGYNPLLGPINLPTTSALGSKKATIFDTNLSRRSPEINLSSLAFLFQAMVSYSQANSKGIQQLETRLNSLGYNIGIKFLELVTLKDGKNSKREIKLVEMLQFIHSVIWKKLFGKVADGLEKSQDAENEFMITDNCPVITQFISVPREFGQLNCSAFTAGIVEGILDCSYFQAQVSAHTVEKDGFPLRTVFLIKFDQQVIERENMRFK